MIVSNRLRAGICVLTAALLVGAEPSRAEEDAAVRLGGPEVVKVGWNTRSLVEHDLNGDGKTDLALINNERARVELLLQVKPGEASKRQRSSSNRWQPVLDDARFVRENVACGIRLFDLTVGDLDGDGRADLAYTGDPDALTIRYQKKDGDFEAKRVIDIEDPLRWVSSTLAADVNSDQRTDLVILTKKRLLVFEQTAAGELDGPRSYALSSNESFGLRALDVNRDSLADLLYQLPEGRDAIRVRLGSRDGGFGPEQSFPIEAPRGFLQPLRLDDGALALVGIQANTGLVEVRTFENAPPAAGDLESIRPRFLSAPTSGSTPPRHAISDLDGNGLPDFVISDAKGAQTWVLLQTSQGLFSEPQAFPSLADVRSVAAGDCDGDGKAEVIVASPQERAVAIASMSSRGRLEYPQILPTTGKPYAVVTADFDNNNDLDVAFVYEDKPESGLALLHRDPDSGAWQQTIVPLADFKTGPRDLRVVDANQDGRLDLAVFAPREPLRLVIQSESGEFQEASVEQGFRSGLVDNIEASQLTLGDADGDGHEEILVAREGFVRAIILASSGDLEVLDQFNARSSDTKVAAAIVLDVDQDGVTEILLVEQGGKRLQTLHRGRSGVFRYRESTAIGELDLVEARVLDLTTNGKPDLLLLGEKRVIWLPLGGRDLTLAQASSYETDLEDVSYHLIAAGDLNSDKKTDVVVVDSRESRTLEILTGNGNWQSAMHFKVFEMDSHYAGQRGSASEPREVIIADLTDDGRDDIALLVHDRVLVYPQLER